MQSVFEVQVHDVHEKMFQGILTCQEMRFQNLPSTSGVFANMVTLEMPEMESEKHLTQLDSLDNWTQPLHFR